MRRFLSVVGVLYAFASVLHAQADRTTFGQVLLPHAHDSVPVPGIRILLHRIGRANQGPIDSVVADAAGRFRFRFKPDTNAMYLLSARYGGVEYFSPPVGTGPAADTALRLVVYDTSSTAPVAVQARNIVVPRPGQDGSRAILELIILKNTGLVARVAPDSAHPSWTLGLPPLTGAMEVGESDFSPDAVIHAGDSVKLVAPLTPGQKQLTLQYQVVPTHGRLEFPIGPAAVAVNLLVEERDAQVRGGTLTLVDSQVVQGRSFRRWTGQVPAGGWNVHTARLGRPFLNRGVPYNFRRYDLPFLHWLAWTGRQVDVLSDADLDSVRNANRLRESYDLIVFPGHHEYVTTHEYDVVEGYRNLGGNLAFLSANNFFWRVVKHGDLIEKTEQWRELGRPEAALIGVQYRGNDRGEHRGAWVAREPSAAPWLFAGTGLKDGSTFGEGGIEIDETTADSPPGVQVLAQIPDLFGPGFTAQMTYYETPAGAKVFAAGAFRFVGSILDDPIVTTMMGNLWARLARP